MIDLEEEDRDEAEDKLFAEQHKANRYQQKLIEVEAYQWFQSGDHPEDNREMFLGRDGKSFLGEGQVVRYFRRPEPEYGGEVPCPQCDVRYHEHGWIDTTEGGYNVCPGDWIITIEGKHYPIKDRIFRAIYEPLTNQT